MTLPNTICMLPWISIEASPMGTARPCCLAREDIADIDLKTQTLEHAYKSYGMPLPWQYYKIRDARTVYGLVPGLNKYPASHHALEDCRRQIDLLHDALEYLKIKELV